MINYFTYININEANPTEIKTYNLDVKLVDTHAKHIIYPQRHKDMVEMSINVGYDYLLLGSHRNNSRIESERERVTNMKNANCKSPARFVISKDGRVWADNTHWTMAYILNNPASKIIDVPAYIVDFRRTVPTIININNSVYDSINCIREAIESAYTIQERIDMGWRPLSLEFKISDLMNELFD